MEIVAGLLALLAGLGGSANFAIDRLARGAVADRLDSAEVLEVRIQAAPNVKLVGGQIDQILLAGRGLTLEPYPRLQLLEIETDPVQVGLNDGELELLSPLQAALRFELMETDLNAALQSPAVLEQFQDIEAELPVFGARDEPEIFSLETPAVELLGQNRLRLKARLVLQSDGDTEGELEIDFATRLQVEAEQRLLLLEPAMMLNGEPVPEEIADAFASGISRALDLSVLDDPTIVARILDVTVTEDSLSAVGFVQLQALELDRGTLPSVSSPLESLESPSN